MKKSFIKTVAVVLCLGFFLTAVPNLNFAAKKTSKISLSALLAQPVQLITTLFPFLNSLFDGGSKEISATIGKVKPPGDISIGRPGTGD
jgi:hypothetical protein